MHLVPSKKGVLGLYAWQSTDDLATKVFVVLEVLELELVGFVLLLVEMVVVEVLELFDVGAVVPVLVFADVDIDDDDVVEVEVEPELELEPKIFLTELSTVVVAAFTCPSQTHVYLFKSKIYPVGHLKQVLVFTS